MNPAFKSIWPDDDYMCI